MPVLAAATVFRPTGVAVEVAVDGGCAFRQDGDMAKKKPRSSPPLSAAAKAIAGPHFDLGVVESRCRMGSEWSIADEAKDIIRELEARRDGKVWSSSFSESDGDVCKWWGMIMKRLDPKVLPRVHSALKDGRLREAIAVVAEGAFRFGVRRGPQIQGGLEAPLPIGVPEALAYADWKEMKRKEVQALLKNGGVFHNPLFSRDFHLPRIPHNLIQQLLKGWPHRDRKERTSKKPAIG